MVRDRISRVELTVERGGGGPLMSEEKKAYVGSVYVAGAQEPKATVVAADGGAGSTGSKTAADKNGDSEGPQRARNPSVLPGILGKQLRAAYGELLNSPVPDRFNDLIKQLQRRESGEAAAAQTPRDEEESS